MLDNLRQQSAAKRASLFALSSFAAITFASTLREEEGLRETTSPANTNTILSYEAASLAKNDFTVLTAKKKKEPVAAELTATSVARLNQSKPSGLPLSILGAMLGFMGYLSYAVKSTPENKRQHHFITRYAAKLFKNEVHTPGNAHVLKIWICNNATLLATGAFLCIKQGQNLASLIAPAAFMIGLAACYPLACTYQKVRNTTGFEKTCEYLSYASLGIFGLAQIPNVASLLSFDGAVVGAWAAVVARTLGLFPFAFEFISKARSPNTTVYPQIKNVLMWTGAAICGALSVESLSTASIVPLGFLSQNLLICCIALGSFCYWKKRH